MDEIEMSYFWLSFLDKSLPDDPEFLGVIVLKAIVAENAIKEINPIIENENLSDCEIAAYEFVVDEKIPEEYLGRLLTWEEAEALDAIIAGEMN